MVGPGLALLIAWQHRLARRHCLFAVFASLSVWLLGTLIGSIWDAAEYVLVPLSIAVLLTLAVTNIQRLKRGEGPLLLGQ
jgi:hypothetical protein